MTVSRIPVFVWAMVAVGFMILFAWPSFTVAPIFLEFSRAWDMQFFSPDGGGDPLLWQHLFWFWGHPVVYVMLLPSTGIVTMIVADVLAAARSSATRGWSPASCPRR